MTNLPQPIKDLGKATFTKAADKFVNFVITKYTGKSIKVFEAECDIEADKVKTKWEVLEKPFWLQAEATKMNRQYSNLGNTLIKAAPLITVNKNKVVDDNDVFWGFLEHSKEISNEKMQELIAKIIAGEYNVPNTYSMSTLQIIKMLGKNELKLFEKISGLLINGTQLPKELFIIQGNVNNLILMQKIRIDFEGLQTLQSLGLFFPNDMQTTKMDTEERNLKNLKIQYFDKKLFFAPNKDNFFVPNKYNYKEITLPLFYQLSLVGEQILEHLNPKYIEEYYIWLKKNYKIPNYKLIEL